MHVQSHCFPNLNLLLFCCSRWSCRHCCLSSLFAGGNSQPPALSDSPESMPTFSIIRIRLFPRVLAIITWDQTLLSFSFVNKRENVWKLLKLGLISGYCFNPLSSKIHIQILQTDLHTICLRTAGRIWFKIIVFSL